MSEQAATSLQLRVNASGLGEGVNSTAAHGIFSDIEFNVDFVLLLLSLACTVAWFTYLSYYHSRLLGFIITRILRRFCPKYVVTFSVGSISLSVLSGKLMFRELLWVTTDYSVRCQDGWLQFKFWKPLVGKQMGEDLSHLEPRLSSYLHGLEIHFFNHCALYQRLARLFPSQVGDSPIWQELLGSFDFGGGAPIGWRWHQLFPVVKVAVSWTRVIFGNPVIPSTLLVGFENADVVYACKPPSNGLDLYMHTLSGSAEDFKIYFVKSLGFDGPYEAPPRIMGQGFSVLQTSQLRVYYYQDEPGLTPAAGIQSFDQPFPLWGADFKLGKGTVVSYGPWADRQRELLYKYFFKSDYQKLAKSTMPGGGQRRLVQSFDLKVSTVCDATLDVLFSENDLTSAIHTNFKPGSYLEVTVPYLLREDGFDVRIVSQLMLVDSSTSMPYRCLLESETVEILHTINYPPVWNHPQRWHTRITGCRSSVWLVYEHKTFIQKLLNDWSSQLPADLFDFVPYEWQWTVVVKEFELTLPINQHNWIDSSSSSQNHENTQLALCGRLLELSFDLPFVQFLPERLRFSFNFEASCLRLSLFLPETHAARIQLDALRKASRMVETGFADAAALEWRNATQPANGWIDCWVAPSKATLSIVYNYFPTYLAATPELYDIQCQADQMPMADFDPQSLPADEMAVEVEVGPSEICLNGVLLKCLLDLKDDYLGDSQRLTDLHDFSEQISKVPDLPYGKVCEDSFRPESFRPMNVKVNVLLQDLQAQLLAPSFAGSVRGPLLFVENFCFELDQHYSESLLQVVLSPITACLDEHLQLALESLRSGPKLVQSGHLCLSGLQLRGHSLCSDCALPLDAPTVEYAWMLELTVGSLSGYVSVSQLLHVGCALDCLQALLFNAEEQLPYPVAVEMCQHQKPRVLCTARAQQDCPSEHELKYRMLRVSVDGIDLILAEEKSALQLSLPDGLRMAHCSLHSDASVGGLTFVLPEINLRELTLSEVSLPAASLRKGASDLAWLECLTFNAAKLVLNLTLPLDSSFGAAEQLIFLQKHDNRSRRLHFLWHSNGAGLPACGCVAGCTFFGVNAAGINFYDDAHRRLADFDSTGDRQRLGFGESLLCPGKLVVRVGKHADQLDNSSQVSLAQDRSGANAADVKESAGAGEEFFETTSEFSHREEERAADEKVDTDSLSVRSEHSQQSFISTATSPEQSYVNLYSQLNRPVFTSPLLMASYSQHLNKYSCRRWCHERSTVSAALERLHARGIDYHAVFVRDLMPKFDLIQPGLNNVALVEDTSSIALHRHLLSTDSDKSEDASSTPTGPTGQNQFVAMRDDVKLQIYLKTSCAIRAMLSPLGIESLERFVRGMHLFMDHTHPAYLLLRLFDRCSSKRHQSSVLMQANSNRTRLSVKAHLIVPQIDIAVFQCGVVEKILPFSELQQAQMLAPSSVFVATIRNCSVHAASLADDSALVGAKVSHYFCQLLQVTDKNTASSTIGISRSASKIPFVANWFLQDCGALVILECGVLALGSTLHLCTVDSDRCECRWSTTVQSFLVNFGLCSTVDDCADNWPLYDIVAPTVSAWLHVGHRFSKAVQSLLAKFARRDLRLMLYCLLAGLQFPKCFEKESGKFEHAKLRRQLLRNCAHCQLMQSLLNLLVKFGLPESFLIDLKSEKGVNDEKALNALLHFCRGHLLTNNLLEIHENCLLQQQLSKYQRDSKELSASAITEPKLSFNSTHCVDIDPKDGEIAPLLSKGDGQLNLTAKRPFAFGVEERRNRLSKTAVKSPISKRLSSDANSADGSLITQKSMENGENLYSWMAREQQQSLHHSKISKDRSGNAVQPQIKHHSVDISLIPPELLFEFLFKNLITDFNVPTSNLQKLMILANNIAPTATFKLSCSLSSLLVGLVEPRIVRSGSATKYKRVSQLDRTVLNLQSLSLAADCLQSSTMGTDATVLAQGQRQLQRAANISYHGHLSIVDCALGFSSVIFLNQMIFVARTARDTICEFEASSRQIDALSAAAQPTIPTLKAPAEDGKAASIKHQMKSSSSFARLASESDSLQLPRTDVSKTSGRKAKTSSRTSATKRNSMVPTSGDWVCKVNHLVSEYQLVALSQYHFLKVHHAESVVLAESFGIVDINELRLQTMMTDLVLFCHVSHVHLGHSNRSKFAGATRAKEFSITAAVERVTLNLSESQADSHLQAVVSVAIDKTQALFTGVRGISDASDSGGNCMLVDIGPISVDIPLNPGLLHGVVVRGTKDISETLRDLRTPQLVEEVELIRMKVSMRPHGQYSRQFEQLQRIAVVNFSILLRSLSIQAALLPSLKASYKMEQLTSCGVSGAAAHFLMEIQRHNITFDVKDLAAEAAFVTPNIQLTCPVVTAQGAYLLEQHSSAHGYMRVEIDVGEFQHTLTTDLLNQLLFIEEAFTRELADIILKITSEPKPPTLWSSSASKQSNLRYQVDVLVKNIQITATTPTATAVRLDTDQCKLAVSNRSGLARGLAEIGVTVSLGQLVKDALFEEIKADYQQFAYFKTHITTRNAPSQTMSNEVEGASAYLISLDRPQFFILPSAVDKAILLWLNYKNAYEFWNEQRQQIRNRSPRKGVWEQLGSPTAPISNSPLFLQVKVEHGFHLCVPLHNPHYSALRSVDDSNSALVLSLDNTDIAICSYGALVSTGQFKGFSVNLVEDFDAAAENWRPDLERRAPDEMNGCFVPSGTYKVCSRTTPPADCRPTVEWQLNIQWEMQGIELNFNTRSGKLLSQLIATFTSLAGEEDDRMAIGSEKGFSVLPNSEPVTPDFVSGSRRSSLSSVGQLRNVDEYLEHPLSDYSGSSSIKDIERAMHEQAKLVNDLSVLGATEATIEEQRRKLQQIEALLFRQFRSDMRQKLRKQSQRATSLKDRFGVQGYRSQRLQRKSEATVLGRNRVVSSRANSSAFPTQRRGSLDVGNVHDKIEEVEEYSNGSTSPSTPTDDYMADIASRALHERAQSPSTEMPDSSIHDGGEHPAAHIPLISVTGAQSPDADGLAKPNLAPLPTPSVDLYLDLKIYIDSGKCTFRTKDAPFAPANDSAVLQRVAGSKDGKLNPRAKHKSSSARGVGSSRASVAAAAASNETEIAIPGVSVRSYYASHSGQEGGLNSTLLRDSGLSEELISSMLSSNKKAQFFMWLALESMPHETVISPHILDFFEQTLEPVALPHLSHSSMSTVEQATASGSHSEDEMFQGSDVPLDVSLGSTMAATPASFPIDVVVNISVQSFTIRFTSLPYSRVECLLKLPSLELVATSRKASDLVLDQQLSSSASLSPEQLSGGVAITVVLSDFSLFVFHPYGTSRQAGVAERKDSLTLQVQSVTVNIARSRNVIFNRPRCTNSVRFSLLVDISSALFKYDMRRLHEILSFPKAWYRRAIVRRLFLGEESMNASTAFAGSGRPGCSTSSTQSGLDGSDKLAKDGDDEGSSSMRSLRDDNVFRARVRSDPLIRHRAQTILRKKSAVAASKSAPANPAATAAEGGWEALVLYAISFAHLDVQTNMANTMGITTWVTKDAGCRGHLAIDSFHRRQLSTTFDLGSSEFESKGGMVGGQIRLTSLNVTASLHEKDCAAPEHNLQASLASSQCKVEWMSACIFMGCINKLRIAARDCWQRGAVEEDMNQGKISCHGEFSWDVLQVMIVRTTVQDFIRIYWRLREFFEQEFRSGRRMFLLTSARNERLRNDKPRKSVVVDSNAAPAAEATKERQQQQPLRFHRHWQKVLTMVSDLQIRRLIAFPLTEFATELGGCLEFSGREVSLACFHGPSGFRSQKWALFHLRQPYITFSTAAVDKFTSESQFVTQIAQHVYCSLGHQSIMRQRAMAYVALITRGHYIPPQLGSIDEWFHYTFVHVLRQIYGAAQQEYPTSTPGSSRANLHQSITQLFRLPALEMNMNSQQVQADEEPTAEQPRPQVTVHFKIDFHDHVYVSNDVESYFLLFELIKSYVGESQRLTDKEASAAATSTRLSDPTQELQKDARELLCEEFRLEPTVRFLDTIEFEPIGVDTILQRLGFRHAKTTIPKWTQRGFMDPLDHLLASTMEMVLLLSKKKKPI